MAVGAGDCPAGGAAVRAGSVGPPLQLATHTVASHSQTAGDRV